MRSDLSYSRYASNPGSRKSRFQSWHKNLKIGLDPTGLSPIFRKNKSVLVHGWDIGNPRNPTADIGRYPIQVLDTKQAPIARSIHQPEFPLPSPSVSLRRSMADPYPIHTPMAILRGKRLWLHSSSLKSMVWVKSFRSQCSLIHAFKASLDGLDRKLFNWRMTDPYL